MSSLFRLGEAQNWRCCYCGVHCDGAQDEHNQATVEHVVPISAGGLRQYGNEVMACRLCNEGRGVMYARAYGQLVAWKGRYGAAHRSTSMKRGEARRAHVDRRRPSRALARQLEAD